jgi:hypothetical protein
MMHIADNQDALLDYLYEEGDPAERLRIAKHLQECASCSVAVLEMQTVRGMLAEWRPPAPQLGFRIVQDPVEVASQAPQQSWRKTGFSWARSSPWAQAAAAVLLFAAGMAVSQVRLDYRDAALTVSSPSSRTVSGGIRNASIVLPAQAPVDAGSGHSQVSTNPPAVSPAAGSPFSGTDAESTEQLLQRVRAMIEQSEARQQRELALRLSQVANEVETQHRADLLRIQQNFGQLEIETGAHINQQQQIMDYLVRTGGVK